MRRFIIVLASLLLVLALLLAPAYLRYRWRAGIVPPWVRLAGMEINGGDRSEIEAALARFFTEPAALYYDDRRLILRPQAVGFQVDLTAMLAEAQAYNTPDRLLRYLVEQTLNRQPTFADVPLRYTVDHNAVDAWLAEAAATCDQAPLPPQPVLATLTISPGRPGRQLDIPASRERVVAALIDPRVRSAALVVRETPPPPLTIAALRDLLQARLDLFPGIASLFLHHIPTGDEIAINADVAYAGMSTLKIAIVTELYRHLDEPPDVETSKLISETMALSGNFTANLLLGIIGDGDPNAGVRVLNESLRTLGLKNTFMAAPYDRKLAGLPRIVTEANSRTDYDTQPDPYMQTTPREIGLVLQMLVECSQGGGTLLAAYGDQYTPAECQQALDYMALNELKELLPGGIPPGTRFVHKHGYVADTHGDVAAIWGPAGPYILSVFLYRPTWLEWELSNSTMREVSQAVWNYFALVSR
jgi:beta-lactamase class A